MVKVKLFGTLRLETGVKELQMEAGTVREVLPAVLRALQAERPECPLTERELRACMIAVNGVQAGLRTGLRDGDEVWLFPVSAGG